MDRRAVVVIALTASASLATASGATAVAGAPATGADTRLVATTAGPTIAARDRADTVPARRIYKAFGVSAHPDWQGASTYEDVDAWMKRLGRLGVRYFRGGYVPGNPGTAEAIAASRKYGVKWLMSVVPEAGRSPTKQTPAQTRAVVEHIGRKAADVVYAIEGLNEPNHNRVGGEVPDNWARIATAHQRAIWKTAKGIRALSRVPIVGPSIQTVEAEASYDPAVEDPVGGRRHYHQLEAAGLLKYQDWAGAHSYPDGRRPAHGLNERLRLLDSAYGDDYPVWLTEWGYHNALRTTEGHDPVPKRVSAIYGPRGLLYLTTRDRKIRLVRYEVLDDVDPGINDDHEAHFGLWRVGSADPATWRTKKEARVLRDMLPRLREPRPARARPVTLAVSGPPDLHWVVTRAKGGSATLWIWRSLSVWDAADREDRSVPRTSVTVTDAAGEREIRVGPDVRRLNLRT